MTAADKVTLPSGAWVQLKDPKSIRFGDKKRMILSMDDVDGLMTTAWNSADQIVRWAVESWSFDLPLPRDNPDWADDLDVPDGEALMTACAPFHEVIFPGVRPAFMENGQPDPKVGEPSSDDSATG